MNVSIKEELEALGAPRKVVDAGAQLDKGVRSRELANYVRDWVTRNQGNNRYGK
jgi:hypothetical protein